jgi:ATP-binding cassette subfamily B protein
MKPAGSFSFKKQAASLDRSGITGHPEDFDSGRSGPGERAEAASAGLLERLARIARTSRGTAVGLAKVARTTWRASRMITILLAVSTLVIGLVPTATVYITRLLVDGVSAAAREGGADRTGPIVTLVVIQFGVFAVGSVGNAIRSITEQLLQQKVSLAVQTRVMDHASGLELAFFEDSASYDLLRQAQQEAATRPVSMISNAFGFFQTSVTFVSMIGLLVGLSPILGVVALLAPVPAFLADARFGRRAFRLTQWASPIRRRMQYLSQLVTSDTAAKEVKLFGLGTFLVDRFRMLGMLVYQRQRAMVTRRYLIYTGWGLLTTLAGSLTYLYVALQAVAGRLTVGDLVLLTGAVAAVQTCVQTMFRNMVAVYEDNLYMNRLHDLTALRTGLPRPDRPVPLCPPVPGQVVFDAVSFSYPGSDTPALREVSFEIRPGQTLAVVGRNGAGKSTLVKLLGRLYDPTGGRITLDGVDLRELDPDQLRAQVAAMFQDYVAYQATAAENIGLGGLDRLDDRETVTEAAGNGGALEFVTRLPLGLDTPLGKWFDKGVELSGGEWQKIALSRAFMRPGGILVLDEPTSALDAQAEHELFERLRQLADGRTTIYVSHRFSTVRMADRILLLEGGRVREFGTHDELLDLGGEYARLFRLQAKNYLDSPGHRQTPISQNGRHG